MHLDLLLHRVTRKEGGHSLREHHGSFSLGGVENVRADAGLDSRISLAGSGLILGIGAGHKQQQQQQQD